MDSSTGPKPRSHIFGFLDETGLLHTPDTDRFFGLGLLITPSPRALHRSIVQIKNQRHFYQEFKFSDVSLKNLPVYKELIDICLSTQSLRFHCFIVDKRKMTTGNHVSSYNGYAGYLIAGAIDASDTSVSEYITVLADDVSTRSIDDRFEHMVRDRIRRVARRNALFGICRLESHAVSELQLCDVLIGLVAYAHKMKAGLVPTKSAKAQLVKYLQKKLNVFSLAQDTNLQLRNKIMFCIKDK